MFYIGVDIGGMSIKCGLVNDLGEIVYSSSVVTPLSGARDIAKATAVLVEDVLAKNGLKKSDVLGIGVGVPGIVDITTQEVKYSCNLFKENAPLGKMLEEESGMKVRIANDADCAAYGECLFGAGKGMRDLILVTLGTGVGGGTVADGKPFAGGKGLGGEIGHMGIGGKHLCGCGRYGCMEAEVSASALIKRVEENIARYPRSKLAKVKEREGKVDGRTLFYALDEGCKVAKGLLDEFLSDLGYGLVNLANIFRPQMILIGGGISAEGEKLTKPLQKYVDDNIYGGTGFARTLVACATLGNKAGIIGAANLLK